MHPYAHREISDTPLVQALRPLFTYYSHLCWAHPSPLPTPHYRQEGLLCTPSPVWSALLPASPADTKTSTDSILLWVSQLSTPSLVWSPLLPAPPADTKSSTHPADMTFADSALLLKWRSHLPTLHTAMTTHPRLVLDQIHFFTRSIPSYSWLTTCARWQIPTVKNVNIISNFCGLNSSPYIVCALLPESTSNTAAGGISHISTEPAKTHVSQFTNP